jgi:hypothetical protein
VVELSTVEARWFSSGLCPQAVVSWFHAGPLVSQSERRTDEYLALPGRHDLRVKLRAGLQIDIKQRTALVAGVALPAAFDGWVEAWTKWSFPLQADQDQRLGRAWTRVEKVRWSRLYEVTPAAVRAAPFGRLVPAGCAAELVTIRVGRHQAWGFGFEAFGEADTLDRVLAAGAGALVADTPADDVAFTRDDSYSYPAWLSDWPSGD